MTEVLYTDEGRKDELVANIVRSRQEIERAVEKACKVLNKLTPDGALYASSWVLTDLIVSLMPDEDAARELLQVMQHQIESELKTAFADTAPSASESTAH